MSDNKISKREEYVAKMKDAIDDINEKIDELEEKSKDTRTDLANQYKQEMAELRAKSDRAKAKLDELKQAGENSWHEMVDEMDKIGKALKHSYNYFKSQL